MGRAEIRFCEERRSIGRGTLRHAAEVVIVGGGPAGCAAALTLRIGGCSVIVVDAPEKKLRPTETAVPGLRELLTRLGASEALAGGTDPCFGFSSNWGRPQPQLLPSILNPFGSALFVHRGEFDRLMQACVRDKGTTWLEAAVSEIEIMNDGASIKAGPHTIDAKWIVDASGSASRIGMRIGRRYQDVDRLVVLWAQLSIGAVLERILSIETTAQGWWYLCPGRTSEAFACFVTDSKTAQRLRAHIPENWTSQLSQTRLLPQAPCRVPDRIHAASFGVGHGDPLLGNRWVAAGDAAIHLDPLSSSGLVTALESGRRAAEAVAAEISGDSSQSQAYSHWANGLIGEFIKQRRDHYQLESGHGKFWQRRLGMAEVAG